MAAVNTCYISCGCKRTPHCADWGRNNLICYGSSRSVVIYQPETVKDGKEAHIVCTVNEHKGNVNCVKWIPEKALGSETELVSGSVDKTIIVWKTDLQQFKASQVLTGHSAPVTAIDVINVLQSCEGKQLLKTIIVSASVDSTVKYGRGLEIKVTDINQSHLLCLCYDA